jgi:4-amino-4-deoxy-L-arabinose transferase-like glycosyltransferase
MINCLRVAPFLLSWIGLFWLCHELAYRKRIGPDWRLSWALASVAWGALVTLLVEVSSLGNMLTAGSLFLGWLLICVVVFASAWRLAKQHGWNFRGAVRRARTVWPNLRLSVRPLDAVLVWGCTAMIIAFLGWVALRFPTTTGDSLTYHLARIMHWMQAQSVAHYPTGNCRQNELGPWSEFATVTLHLLWGSDRLVNLVQWFAMLSSVLVAPFIALQLFRSASERKDRATDAATGAAREGRLAALTGLLVATLPIGIVEAVTTQTDYTTTFWLVSLTAVTLALAKDPRNGWYVFAAGLALGLGVLTKATMLLYSAPLLLVMACWLGWRHCGLRLACLFLATAVVLNVGHMTRNYAVVGSPLAGPYIHHLVSNKTVSPGGTWSNVVRNLALETTTPFASLNEAVNRVLMWLHKLCGRDLNDPDTTYELCLFQWPKQLLVYDSQASNPFHLLLILIAIGLALARWQEHRLALGYAAVFAASFVLFSAWLRWQEWHSRMHLPYLVVLMPFVAVIFIRLLTATAVWTTSLMAVAVGVHCLCKNESRPLLDPTFTRLPREAQYMAIHTPHFYQSYFDVCQDVIASGCTNVGLKLQYGEMEYAFWIMLRNRGFAGRLHHVDVEDASRKIPSTAPPPCLVITTFDPPPAAVTNDFPLCRKYGHVTVCGPKRDTQSL